MTMLHLSTSRFSLRQIANVGFYDVSNEAVLAAVAADTLFIHGSTNGGGGKSHTHISKDERDLAQNGCTEACGYSNERMLQGQYGVSTVCDYTCWIDEYGNEPRFGGYLCGAGLPSKYGSACRTCYTDHFSALADDRELALDNHVSGKHVIMCDSRQPPQALECSAECAAQDDTVSAVCCIENQCYRLTM